MHAIELLNAIRDHNAGEPLGRFAAQLLIECNSKDRTKTVTDNWHVLNGEHAAADARSKPTRLGEAGGGFAQTGAEGKYVIHLGWLLTARSRQSGKEQEAYQIHQV